ncbi:hypothetical protein [Streptomyces iconiensis]|uniref:Uncharacterized protein n=1 Tax=Streptomyces iconiensis TaxID=1384038 RepID=A0ABT6ZPM0_9ACTN|nr:hypothetical protein [Streptomyces iconiensis]MDJ1130998.1 hypothetical protein [Streptomyces iconiensis]
MSLDRRQLLRGSLAAGAAAVPFGALAAPAYGAGGERRAAQASGFMLALLDANNNVIENHHTGDITTDAQKQSFFGAPRSTFSTGSGADAWAPLECKFRQLNSGESVFMVCGGTPSDGRVTIHRKSDSAALGWTRGLTIFPHSLEYLQAADVVVVVGTRGLPTDPAEEKTGGVFELYTAPTKEGPSSFQKVPDSQKPFRQAHGVVRDQNRSDVVWIYGGNKLVGYRISGHRETTKLKAFTRLTDEGQEWKFENGHDLQPDPVDTQFLWATGSEFMFKINKSGGTPRVEWFHRLGLVKSFSRDRSGRGVWTASPALDPDNKYGTDKVNFMWKAQTVTAPRLSGQGEKRIYKARLTDI